MLDIQAPAGDPHKLLTTSSGIYMTPLSTKLPVNWKDFTPIASLFNDYVVFAVNAGAPIKTGKELIERLKKDPKSVATGFATTLGSHNHIAAGLLMKAIGGSARDLKAVAFKGSSEAVTALLGNHLELVTTAGGNYNTGRYSDYGARRYIVPGATAEDAMKWLQRNEDWVYMYMDTQKSMNGKRIVRRPASSNVFLDNSSIFGEAPPNSNSAIENFIRKHRAV